MVGINPHRPATAAAVSEDLRAEIGEALSHPNEIFGYGRYGDGTHWVNLDKMTGGLQRFNWSVLVARPKVGKSMLAAALVPYIAEQALLEEQVVRIVSLEMRKKAYQRRMAALLAGIKDPKDIRRGMLDKMEQRRYLKALDYLATLPIEYLSNEEDLTEEEALRLGNSPVTFDEVDHFIRAKGGQKTYWWLLDHIGLLSDLREYGDVTTSIYSLANRLAGLAHKVASGMTVSHLTRQSVGNMRPSIESIAGSDQVGRNADQIFLLTRPYFETGDLSPEDQEAIKDGEPAFLTFYSRDEGSGIDILWWDTHRAAFDEMNIEGVSVDKLMPKSKKKR